MKVISQSTDKLVLHPSISTPIWIAVIVPIIIFVVGTLQGGRSAWLIFCGILFWAVVIGLLVFLPHGLVTKCTFSKPDNHIFVQRYALYSWGGEHYLLSDVSGVEIYKQNEFYFTVLLKSQKGNIRLQGDISQSSAERLARTISDFLSVPQSVAI